MAELEYEPAMGALPQEHFQQTIRLREGAEVIGSAAWHVSGTDGVVQLLYLIVEAGHRRRGNGRAMLLALIAQAQSYHRLRKQKLRRLWTVVDQKTQVIGRAFLMSHGFHHTATLPDLHVKEDALVYLRTFR